MRFSTVIPALLAAIAVVGPLSMAGQSAPQGQMQSLFRAGAQAMHAGDPAAAEQSFRKATELAPDFPTAWLDMGLAQLKQNKMADAIASIRKALELDPSATGAHLFLGIAEYQSSRADEAVVDLQQAIAQNPRDVQALTWLGIVELNSGHPEKAAEPLDRAAELSPKDENVLDYRVQAHMAVAKQSYSQLYNLNPASWRLHRLNAVVDAQALDHKGAIDEYQLAIKLAPNQPDLYEGLGWEYRALGQADKAAQAFEQQLKLTPGNPIAMYNLGSSEVEAGQVQAAANLLQKVVAIYQVPTGADYYLGRALAAEGNYSNAAKEFQRATGLEGEMQRRSWYELSQAYRHLGETAEARAAVDKYQQLKQAADAASARQVEDWRKLNAANAAADTAAH